MKPDEHPISRIDPLEAKRALEKEIVVERLLGHVPDASRSFATLRSRLRALT